MLVATIIFSFLSFSVPISKRVYHVVTTFIVAFATLSYFAMVSRVQNLSSTTTDIYRPPERASPSARLSSPNPTRSPRTPTPSSSARSSGPAMSTGALLPRSFCLTSPSLPD